LRFAGAGPDGAVAVLKQAGDSLFLHLVISGELLIFPTRQAFRGANPESAVASDQQFWDFIAGQLLTRRRLPWDSSHTIETQQAKLCAQPNVPVRCLCD